MVKRLNYQKQLNKLSELNSSRHSLLSDQNHNSQDFVRFLSNFIINFGDLREKSHLILSPEFKPYNKKHFVHIEYKQYISSIVTTLETFFRDTCFFLLVQNEQMIGELCEFYKLENADTHNLSINDQANYLSACFNFQNFKEIDELFSKILGINFWDNLGTSLFRNCSFENILLEKISLNQLIPSWKNSLEELLFIRNEIIHNANFRLTVNSKFITPAELTVLLVPQFTTLLVAQKYSLKNFKLNYEGKQYNFLFSIKDLIHSNWQIAEESTSSISLD